MATEGFEFQPRDGLICQAIDAHDGVLAKCQIAAWFWPESVTDRATEMRLSALCAHDYLCRPSPEQVRRYPKLAGTYTLGWRGAVWVAQQRGVDVDMPETMTEVEQRAQSRTLREQGIAWKREARGDQVEHDLLLSDVRHAIEQAAVNAGLLVSEAWVYEGAWRTASEKNAIFPDAVFALKDSRRETYQVARFLVEFDNTTKKHEDLLTQMGGDMNFLLSDRYRQRFGVNAGRVLWVFASENPRRMKELLPKAAAALKDAASLFRVTTLADVTSRNSVTGPIWWIPRRTQPVTLLTE